MPRDLLIIGPVVRENTAAEVSEWVRPIYYRISEMPRRPSWQAPWHLNVRVPEDEFLLKSGGPEQLIALTISRIKSADAVFVVLPHESTIIGIEVGIAVELGKRLGVITRDPGFVPAIL